MTARTNAFVGVIVITNLQSDGASFLGSRHSDIVRNSLAHCHEYYELNFLTSGKTKMRINSQVIDYDSYDFLLIPPGVMHILHESEYERFDNCIIWFQYVHGALPDSRIIKLHDYDGSVQFLCSRILKMYTNGGMDDIDLINAYLKAVLLHMNKGLVMSKSIISEKEDLVDKAVQLINTSIGDKDLSVNNVVKKLNISNAHFSRIFKMRIGVSPVKYIIGVRIAEAKRMLLQENMTIKEIAGTLSYNDPLYFSRQFTNIVGISPSEFRNRASQSKT